MRRTLSAILALVLVFSLMGTAVYAAEGNTVAGTYTGTYNYQPSGMPMAIAYSFTMTLNEGGTYTFVSSYDVSGTTYAGLDETGTYTVNDTALTITAADGSSWTGTINEEGTISMNRPVAGSMSGGGYGSSFDITLTRTVSEEDTEEETEAPTEAPTEEEDTNTILASGTCGDNLTWTVDKNYVLTISGTGAMGDYGFGTTPWKDYHSDITAVVINEGVTRIGGRAFMMATRITSITAASSVAAVGDYAIYGCTALEKLELPGVTSFGNYSVRGCTKLTSVTLSEQLTKIASSTFYGCTGLTEITIPAAVSAIDSYAFYDCTSLTAVHFEGDAPSIYSNSFGNVTATCHYPADNETWTEEKMTNYGGTLTWVAAGSDDGSADAPADYSAYAGAYNGTYTYQPGGMPMAINYSFAMTLNADGTYTFVSSYDVSGTDYAGLDETGTYTVEEGTITVTAADGSSWTGTISDGTITMNRPVAPAMSGSGYGSSFDVTMTMGGSTGDDSGDTDDSEDEEVDGETGATPSVPEDTTPDDTAALESGCYAVDITWSPMASMFAPILEIDAGAMTFSLYNETAPETSKGAGTVTYADGVYTLTYENGNTTTFTHEDGVITFTSKLWYGTASFNQADDNGNFISYTATLVAEEGSEPESERIAGTYAGKHTYQPTGMPMSLMYSFTMELKEDGTYTFTCNYGTDETYGNAGLNDSGTYTLENGVLTITAADGTSWTGTVSEDGTTIEMNRPLTAAMSGSGYGSSFDIVLTLVVDSDDKDDSGDTGSDEEEETPDATDPEETEPEGTEPEETEPETTEPEETEPPKSTVISVSSLSELEPGTYKLTAELDCYMTAMGGCQFGGVLRSAYLIVDENGSASMKLYFRGDAELSMMYGTTTFCVNPSSEISYWNGSKWVNASYTTATATDEEGTEYTYVSSMTFPVSKVQDTYDLGLGFGGGSMGAQFGGNSAQMLSDGSVLKATLTINWSKVYTNPVTGDETNVIPFVILMAAAACGIAALVVLKKRKVF